MLLERQKSINDTIISPNNRVLFATKLLSGVRLTPYLPNISLIRGKNAAAQNKLPNRAAQPMSFRLQTWRPAMVLNLLKQPPVRAPNCPSSSVTQ
jgi:hypothetical protein